MIPSKEHEELMMTSCGSVQEELISELTRSEHEWGLARKQYQVGLGLLAMSWWKNSQMGISRPVGLYVSCFLV